MITLLLVEEDLLVRQGLRIYLQRAADITVIGEASNSAEALTLARTFCPRVVLLDLSASLMDGIATTAALHTAVPSSTIVALLSLSEDVVIQAQARAAGAVMIIRKQEGVQALLAAIRQAGAEEPIRPFVTPQEADS